MFSIAEQEIVTQFISDDINHLGGDVFELQKGIRFYRKSNAHLRFGIYVHKARVVIEPKYTSVRHFTGGLLEICKDRHYYGLVSVDTGKIVLTATNSRIEMICGRVNVNKNGDKKVYKVDDLVTS